VYDIYMRFIDGTSVRFRARRFDISVARASAQAIHISRRELA
jgi:hypothetical protein